MDYIDRIFERADIQKIRAFLLEGDELYETDPGHYNERVERIENIICGYLHKKFPYTEVYEEAYGEVIDYGSAMQNVFLEIGIKVGIKLASQFFSDSVDDIFVK